MSFPVGVATMKTVLIVTQTTPGFRGQCSRWMHRDLLSGNADFVF
jgi:hypothetical protein